MYDQPRFAATRSPDLKPGEVYGCWTVIAPARRDFQGRRCYLVRASCCGAERIRERSSIFWASGSTFCGRCIQRNNVNRFTIQRRSIPRLHSPEALERRAELRESPADLQRCMLPRPPTEACEEHLSGLHFGPCAALLFPRELEAHLKDIHRGASGHFVAAAPVKDEDDET